LKEHEAEVVVVVEVAEVVILAGVDMVVEAEAVILAAVDMVVEAEAAEVGEDGGEV
jgi:hypothetical protein